MSAQAARRADLDLPVSLLTEHEVTELITLVKAIAEHLHLQVAADPELPQLERDVAPEQVLDVIEKHEHDSTSQLTNRGGRLPFQAAANCSQLIAVRAAIPVYALRNLLFASAFLFLAGVWRECRHRGRPSGR
jgi:hypothetical protein